MHLPLQFLRSVGRPCCGDIVEYEEDSNRGTVVTRILPRSNVFARADQYLEKQIIAANLDRILIVIAPEPMPSQDLVERYLVASHNLGIVPILVINKTDLMSPDKFSEASPLGRLDEYRSLGYDLVRSSCNGVPGVSELLPYLANRKSIFVGQSGVGKSSLVNALIPDLDIQIGQLSDSTGKGRHTTTTTRMYSMDNARAPDGRLVDSPGVWEFGLWKLGPAELAEGFTEFRPYFGQCRFNDCIHNREPGCAIKSALDKGEIPAWRYESYARLLSQQ